MGEKRKKQPDAAPSPEGGAPVPAKKKRGFNGDGGRISTDKELKARNPHDFYPTPPSLCRAVIDALRIDQPSRILDPGAGSGTWGAAARRRWGDTEITGIELRPVPKPEEYNHWIDMDYLIGYKGGGFDLVIGNPPYGDLAEQFIRRSLAALRPGGILIQLLRLAFLGSDDRGSGLWQEFPTKEIWVLSRRPSFTGDGKTDATNYAMFVWQAGEKPPKCDLTWFNWTPDKALDAWAFKQSQVHYKITPPPVKLLLPGF